jgi:hypothetical protein
MRFGLIRVFRRVRGARVHCFGVGGRFGAPCVSGLTDFSTARMRMAGPGPFAAHVRIIDSARSSPLGSARCISRSVPGPDLRAVTIDSFLPIALY